MKKAKRLAAVTLVVLVASLCACGSKVRTKTAAEIKDIVSEGIYEIEGNYYFSEGSSDDSFTALFTNGWSFSFVDFKDHTDACNAEFEFSKLTWADDDNGNVKEISDDYIIIEGMTNEERYQLISRKGNTLLFIAGPSKDKSSINLYASSFGYYE